MCAFPNPQIALAMLNQAVAQNPNDAGLRCQLGTQLLMCGRSAEAAAQLRKATALRPDFPEALINLGNALVLLGDVRPARAAFEAALNLVPQDTLARYGLGETLLGLGELALARTHLDAALAGDPANPVIHRAVARSKIFALGDPQIAQMEALLPTLSSATGRMHLHFALGKAYDDTQRRDEAFAQWQRGNAIRRAAMRVDPLANLGFMARCAECYTADVMARFAGAGDASAMPIFVVGMPRSGTTLVEQILSSHPEVFGAGEIDTLLTGIAAVLQNMSAVSDPSAFNKRLLRRLGAHYVASVRPLAPTAARIVNKTPGNFLFAGLIHMALPNARIVHIRRDPLDTCLSCYVRLFTESNAFTFDLNDLGRYYGAYVRLMAHWRAVLPPHALLEIDYEALVNDFDSQARRLVDFCGLRWDEACRDFNNSDHIVQSASRCQVRQPLYKTAIGRWRPYAAHLGPLIEALRQSGVAVETP